MIPDEDDAIREEAEQDCFKDEYPWDAADEATYDESLEELAREEVLEEAGRDAENELLRDLAGGAPDWWEEPEPEGIPAWLDEQDEYLEDVIEGAGHERREDDDKNQGTEGAEPCGSSS